MGAEAVILTPADLASLTARTRPAAQRSVQARWRARRDDPRHPGDGSDASAGGRTAGAEVARAQERAHYRDVPARQASAGGKGAEASMKVAALFVRADSVYKTLDGVDAWDIERDARLWQGGYPVVAHPPCRAWGRLRAFANPRADEKELATWAVDQVRTWGGVLEHPAGSTLWPAKRLPAPGATDAFGGFTMPIHQHWFGHRAEKSTWLYIVGVDPSELPSYPMRMETPTHVVNSRKRGDSRPEITKAEREHTPIALARWLVGVAQQAGRNRRSIGQQLEYWTETPEEPRQSSLSDDDHVFGHSVPANR